MKEYDLRKNNGGKRQGAGRKKMPADQKPIKKAVYIPRLIEESLKEMGITNFNKYVNRLIINDMAKF